MAVPSNILQSVQTYQQSALAALVNQSPFFDSRVANMKFRDFENLTAQLGDTVTFDLPYRFVAQDTLTVTYQPTTQRVHSLKVDQAKNIAPAFTAEQFVFNVEKYMDQIGLGGMQELGAVIEANVADEIINHTYRYYGDPVTPINSFSQLATALAYFRNYGAVRTNTVGIIDDIAAPAIIGTGLNEFALNRNNEIANSWELGSFSRCDWFTSNQLPIHIAGVCGQSQTTLTFVSINPAGDQITFSGAGTQVGFLKSGDLLTFLSDVRYLTFIGHTPSANQVQVRITADADSNGGTVVANIYPALNSDVSTATANLSRPLVGTDTAKVLNSHRVGIIMAGKPLFIGMPQLPSTTPFPSAQSVDPDTGVSLRMYYGELFGQNQRALVHDVIWGRTYVDEYCMRLVFPL